MFSIYQNIKVPKGLFSDTINYDKIVYFAKNSNPISFMFFWQNRGYFHIYFSCVLQDENGHPKYMFGTNVVKIGFSDLDTRAGHRLAISTRLFLGLGDPNMDISNKT